MELAADFLATAPASIQWKRSQAALDEDDPVLVAAKNDALSNFVDDGSLERLVEGSLTVYRVLDGYWNDEILEDRNVAGWLTQQQLTKALGFAQFDHPLVNFGRIGTKGQTSRKEARLARSSARGSGVVCSRENPKGLQGGRRIGSGAVTAKPTHKAWPLPLPSPAEFEALFGVPFPPDGTQLLLREVPELNGTAEALIHFGRGSPGDESRWTFLQQEETQGEERLGLLGIPEFRHLLSMGFKSADYGLLPYSIPDEKVFAFLVREGMRVSGKDNGKALIRVADPKRIEQLGELGSNPNVLINGSTPLTLAVRLLDETTIPRAKALLKIGADPFATILGKGMREFVKRRLEERPKDKVLKRIAPDLLKLLETAEKSYRRDGSD